MAFRAGRTAIRLSLGLTMLGIDEGAEGPALCRYLVAELDKLGLDYLHIIDGGDLTRRFGFGPTLGQLAERVGVEPTFADHGSPVSWRSAECRAPLK